MVLSHAVYFLLTDPTSTNLTVLCNGCREFLSDHPGVLSFSVGRVSDLDRHVNDRDYHVALVIVFKDRDSHDTYQRSARHTDFVAAFAPSWKKVRVFDADLETFTS